MQCGCCGGAGGWCETMVPGLAGGAVTATKDDELRWETDDYDFALDALEFQADETSAACAGPEVDAAAAAPTRGFVLTRQLDAPLRVGSHIVFQGTSAAGAERVTFNIGGGDDVAVHVDARLSQRCVVRNTRRRNRWGTQETTAFRAFPFAAGRPFVVEALIAEHCSLWAVDGMHYCEYAHRDPSPLGASAPGSSFWIELLGASDATIDVGHAEMYPVLASTPPEVPSRSAVDARADAEEPSWAPHAVALLPDGLPAQHQLVVHARLRPLLHSFRIELASHVHEWPSAEVPLHVEVRAYVEPQQPRQLVVINARLDGRWGDERRQRSAALVPNTAVVVRVVHGAGAWRVFAGGALLGELAHRMPPGAVRALRLRGDLVPSAVFLAPAAPSDQ